MPNSSPPSASAPSPKSTKPDASSTSLGKAAKSKSPSTTSRAWAPLSNSNSPPTTRLSPSPNPPSPPSPPSLTSPTASAAAIWSSFWPVPELEIIQLFHPSHSATPSKSARDSAVFCPSQSIPDHFRIPPSQFPFVTDQTRPHQRL